MHVRRFQLGDEPALFQVYCSAIRMIASRDYTPEQIEAWAPTDLDRDLWHHKMQEIKPFVVESNYEIVGYADLQPNGYIDHFFVSGHHPRRGVGAMLMRRIHEEAAALGLIELTSDVSRTAEPFYVHFGFSVVERKEFELRGVLIQNARIRKGL
jgi:putative acetyltransferase